ncbi:hypothetical protein WICPIJ_004941 [Wickerhamomyces pijperi]|uniref:Uncharacterized protein n=1 Tax=Wickerhamomyces pijperi TaxID=599730 RepID=A0A9P8Q6P9_WICPI|nr:hypothetical protein WICPIJ_004941 [Wickerhamomyces pijperi]
MNIHFEFIMSEISQNPTLRLNLPIEYQLINPGSMLGLIHGPRKEIDFSIDLIFVNHKSNEENKGSRGVLTSRFVIRDPTPGLIFKQIFLVIARKLQEQMIQFTTFKMDHSLFSIFSEVQAEYESKVPIFNKDIQAEMCREIWMIDKPTASATNLCLGRVRSRA